MVFGATDIVLQREKNHIHRVSAASSVNPLQMNQHNLHSSENINFLTVIGVACVRVLICVRAYVCLGFCVRYPLSIL